MAHRPTSVPLAFLIVRRRDEGRHRQSRSAGNATLQGSSLTTSTLIAAGNRQLSSKVKKAQRIFQLAQEGADAYRMFKLRRAGAGTVFVNEVVNHLKFLVAQELGADSVNQFLSVASRQAVDFWLEDEQTIIEMEFNILSSPPVLEKQVFKALLAKDAGKDVRQLILIGDPGSALLSRAPTPASIAEWLERRHQIRVQLWELHDTREP
jgi:hypothetical protein